IVGHAASVQAQATAAIGEAMYAFSSWSDGGALTHTVTATAPPPAPLVATYHLIGDDAPDTCAAAPIQSVGSSPVSARFGKANDVDWIRFSVTSTRWYRFVAGNLPVDAVMTLYHGCSTALASSNAAGTHWEEILRSMTPGTYALRIASVGGAQSATPYRWQVQALSGTTPLLTSRSISTSSIRYVGDVFNTSTSPRSITIKATMYSASGKVLKSVTTHPLVTILGVRARSPFVVSTSRPAGLSYIRLTVTSTSASRATRLLSVAGTASAPTPSTWKINGTITNSSSTTARNVAYIAEIYDSFGSTINATASGASPSTLARGRKTTFSVTFSGLTATPSATTLRARAT
ncbi:MAG TPA: FxLYD domain-containing protein, partial [Candidatus Limnocylindrales bacterium]